MRGSGHASGPHEHCASLSFGLCSCRSATVEDEKWHIGRHRNASRQKQSLDSRTWSSPRMRFFTRSAQPVRKNRTVMPSTNLSDGTVPNHVWHLTELSSFAIGSFSNRRTLRPPPPLCVSRPLGVSPERWVIADLLAMTSVNSLLCQTSTCLRIGSKLRCIRSTPTEMQSEGERLRMRGEHRRECG